MNNDDVTLGPYIYAPFPKQTFKSFNDWVNRASSVLTAHPQYHNTEHNKNGWNGSHFTAMCFDSAGKRCYNGGDFKDAIYPVWWVWPDQIVELLQLTYRNDYKTLEQEYMSLKDDYSEIARELGFEGVGFWGDPIVSHKEIIDKVRELVNKASLT